MGYIHFVRVTRMIMNSMTQLKGMIAFNAYKHAKNVSYESYYPMVSFE